jgi:hypothetical protein
METTCGSTPLFDQTTDDLNHRMGLPDRCGQLDVLAALPWTPPMSAYNGDRQITAQKL